MYAKIFMKIRDHRHMPGSNVRCSAAERNLSRRSGGVKRRGKAHLGAGVVDGGEALAFEELDLGLCGRSSKGDVDSGEDG